MLIEAKNIPQNQYRLMVISNYGKVGYVGDLRAVFPIVLLEEGS